MFVFISSHSFAKGSAKVIDVFYSPKYFIKIIKKYFSNSLNPLIINDLDFKIYR